MHKFTVLYWNPAVDVDWLGWKDFKWDVAVFSSGQFHRIYPGLVGTNSGYSVVGHRWNGGVGKEFAISCDLEDFGLWPLCWMYLQGEEGSMRYFSCCCLTCFVDKESFCFELKWCICACGSSLEDLAMKYGKKKKQLLCLPSSSVPSSWADLWKRNDWTILNGERRQPQAGSYLVVMSSTQETEVCGIQVTCHPFMLEGFRTRWKGRRIAICCCCRQCIVPSVQWL